MRNLFITNNYLYKNNLVFYQIEKVMLNRYFFI